MTFKRFRVVKPEIRVIGIDDGAFKPHVKGRALVVGVVFRGGFWLDGVVSTSVEIDGFDAAEKIAEMIARSPHFKQLRVIMLDGVTFAGFNVVDIKELNARTSMPVIAVTRDKPDFVEIRKALRHLPRADERWRAVQNAGSVVEVSTRHASERVFIEFSGLSECDAERIVRQTSTRSSVPEALRVAHLVASGVTVA